mgnify:CR=1 FL=1
MSSSLGFTPGSSRTPRARPLPVSSDATSSTSPKPTSLFIARAVSAEGVGLVPLRWSQALVALNLLLFGAHTAVVVTTLMADIRFPITVYQTRLKDEVNANFTCIYDFAQRDGERFCTVDAYTASGNSTPTAECAPVVAAFNAGTGALPSTDELGSPLLQAYSSGLSPPAGGRPSRRDCHTRTARWRAASCCSSIAAAARFKCPKRKWSAARLRIAYWITPRAPPAEVGVSCCFGPPRLSA